MHRSGSSCSFELRFAAAAAIARTGFIGFRVVGASFTCGRDILGAGTLQNLLPPLHPIGIVAMHREQNATLLDHSFIALGLVLGNSHADESAQKSSHYSARAGACQ